MNGQQDGLNINSYISLGLVIAVFSGMALGAKAYYSDQYTTKEAQVAISNTLDKFIAVNEQRIATQVAQSKATDAQMDALRIEVRGVATQVVSLSAERYYRYEEREFRRGLQKEFPDKKIPELSASPQ